MVRQVELEGFSHITCLLIVAVCARFCDFRGFRRHYGCATWGTFDDRRTTNQSSELGTISKDLTDFSTALEYAWFAKPFQSIHYEYIEYSRCVYLGLTPHPAFSAVGTHS